MGHVAEGLVLGAWAAAQAAADVRAQTASRLPEPPAGRVVVVGAGKAAAAMAAAAEQGYGPAVRLGGLVVTRYGHAHPTTAVEVAEAAHPVPDAAGVAATHRILDLVRGASSSDLVLCLLSGGGSALACAPSGVTLAEKAGVTAALLAGGADIRALNIVRKHLSSVKGGWLAAASGAPVVTLAVSDVVGDDPGTIASGPTVPDESTYADALRVLDQFAPRSGAARLALEAGTRGERPETPKPGDPRLAASTFALIATGPKSVSAAAAYLRGAGVEVVTEDPLVTGDSVAVALAQAAAVRALIRDGPVERPLAWVFGGETTVDRRGAEFVFGGAQVAADGAATRGGPNGEWALAFVAALGPGPRPWLLAADTDGIDGASDAAGALLTPGQAARLDPVQVADYLRRHASHDLLAKVGGLFVTGPTLTNVNALRVALFWPDPDAS